MYEMKFVMMIFSAEVEEKMLSLCNSAVTEYLQRRTITPCHLYRPFFSTYNSFYCRHFQDIFVDTTPVIFKVIFANVNIVVCLHILQLSYGLFFVFPNIFSFFTRLFSYRESSLSGEVQALKKAIEEKSELYSQSKEELVCLDEYFPHFFKFIWFFVSIYTTVGSS